jgi:hypothetical protein
MDRTNLPPSDQLEMLSIRGAIALAVRASRRVLPLCCTYNPRCFDNVQYAIDFAEGFASIDSSSVPSKEYVQRVVANAKASCVSDDVPSSFAADAAALVAAAVGKASDSSLVITAVSSVLSAAVDAIEAMFADESCFVEEIWLDFDRLISMSPSASDNVNLGSVVDFRELGPLWSCGRPKFINPLATTRDKIKKNVKRVEDLCNYYIEASGSLKDKFPYRYSLAFYIDPGEASSELIADFYTTLAAYYISLGGSGLEIANEEFRTMVPEVVS